jgi:hypothetical protein
MDVSMQPHVETNTVSSRQWQRKQLLSKSINMGGSLHAALSMLPRKATIKVDSSERAYQSCTIMV